MIINLIKKQKGYEVIKEFHKKYGSFENLEKLYKDTGSNLFLVDLENWKIFQENPDETLESMEIKIADKLILTEIELKILDLIKNENPKSIRELARFLDKDIKIIHPKIKNLEKTGLLELKDGVKNSKIPVMNYDKIEITI